MEIRPLPEDVIDKIAAGEVVERPSHMVKELIENSLDAGATKIQIEVSEGGRCVRLLDNGFGIPQKQLVTALERHTTSKIRDFEELSSLRSFGFRGEALATIGAVSRLDIASRPSSQESGYSVQCDFGKKSSRPNQAAVNFGTSVTVQDLFGNVPARLKFLKSPAAELSQIRYVVQAAALSHPEVEFAFQVNGQFDSQWPATQDISVRAKSILQVEKLYRGRAEVGSFSCEVLFASPDETRGNSRGIWLFVQNRWIQDRGLQAAVMDAYRSLLMHGEYPVVVVRLNCDPSEVDVNVHPTKSQVRFRDSRQAFQCVHRALRSGLETAPWGKRESPAGFDEAIQTPMSFSTPEFGAIVVKQKSLHAPQTSYQSTPTEEISSANEAPFNAESATQKNWSSLRLVGQVNSTYLIAESAQSLVLIDQHAAHERIYFERLRKIFSSQATDVQSYLLPLGVALPAPQVELLLSLRDEFARLGIEMDQGGVDSVIVRAAPAWISESALVATLTKTAEDIFEKGGSFAWEKNLNEICASLACHSAIRAGQTLSLEEMQALTQQMDEFAFSNYCPHGRPVMVELPWTKLERDFGRIV